MNIKKLNIDKPHDSFFKAIAERKEIFRDLLLFFLSQSIISQIDFSTLELVESSSVDELFNIAHGDIIYRVYFKGKKGVLYIVIEQQTNADIRVFVRLKTHEVAIQRKHLNDGGKNFPLVIKVYLYSGQKPYTGPRTFVQASNNPEVAATCIGPQGFFFTALGEYQDADLAKNGTASLGLLVMKHGSARDFYGWFGQKRDLFWELYEKCGYKELVMSYIFACDRRDPEALRQRIIENNPSKKTDIMSAAHQLINQGIREGMERGMQWGVKRGMKQGIEKGMQQGVEKGMQQGVEKGMKQGVEKGMKRGVEKGMKQGVEKGMQQGIQRLASLLLSKNVVSKEDLEKAIGDMG